MMQTKVEIMQDKQQDIVVDIETEGLLSFQHRVTAIGVKTEDGELIFMYENEKETLLMFWEYIRGLKHIRLITFNGMSFDIPFLVARSMKHNVRIPKIGFHLDLRKVLVPYGGKGKLDDFAQLIGMGKCEIDGEKFNGAAAVQMWQEKDYEKLKRYLLEDLRITWTLLQRLKNIGWVK